MSILDWYKWLKLFLRFVRRWLKYRTTGYNAAAHPDPPWRWDRNRLRWIFRPSEDEQKGYICTEYTCARIRGRPPFYGPNATFTDTTEIEAALHELGWRRRERACNCGCGPGQSRNCVVVYWENGQVVHAAVFDHVKCDWGGKLGAGPQIARYEYPEDYYPLGVVPAGAEMRFYCPLGANEEGGPGVAPGPGEQKTDEWLHENAAER